MALLPLIGLAHLNDAPDDGDEDTVDLVTAETIIRLRASADRTQPWPANIAAINAGGADIRSADAADTITLIAGGRETQSLQLDLS